MPRLFTDVLRDLDGGMTAAKLTEQLALVVAGVMKTRKKGSVTLTLDLSPNGDTAISIADTIKVKVPEEVRGKSNFFVTSDMDLTRRDPRQQEMFRKADTGEERAEQESEQRANAQPPRRVDQPGIRRVVNEETERRVAAE